VGRRLLRDRLSLFFQELAAIPALDGFSLNGFGAEWTLLFQAFSPDKNLAILTINSALFKETPRLYCRRSARCDEKLCRSGCRSRQLMAYICMFLPLLQRFEFRHALFAAVVWAMPVLGNASDIGATSAAVTGRYGAALETARIDQLRLQHHAKGSFLFHRAKCVLAVYSVSTDGEVKQLVDTNKALPHRFGCDVPADGGHGEGETRPVTIDMEQRIVIHVPAGAAFKDQVVAAFDKSREKLSGMRTWTDLKGREIYARRKGLADGKVQLQTPAGKVVTVPIAKLSAGDREHAEKGVAVIQRPVFWLSCPSGKRHNHTCKYFRKTNGRACDSKTGEVCGVCGG
jgi:hypothetical protein